MLLLQTVTHIHCRAIRRGILTKISLRIEHAGGKYVMVTEDGSVEATGCKIDDSTSFYIREPIPDVFTFESVQNKTQFLLVNETGDLVVASPPELEGSGSAPADAPYKWRLQIEDIDGQGVLALTTSINDTDCFIAFNMQGEPLPPCEMGLTLDARIVFGE